jgi:hypothetical protein
MRFTTDHVTAAANAAHDLRSLQCAIALKIAEVVNDLRLLASQMQVSDSNIATISAAITKLS